MLNLHFSCLSIKKKYLKFGNRVARTRLLGAVVGGLLLGLAFGGLLDRLRLLNLFLNSFLLLAVFVVVIIGAGVGKNGPICRAGSGSMGVLPLLYWFWVGDFILVLHII